MFTELLLLFVILAIFIAVLLAWLTSINLFIKTGVAKGYTMANKGLLWFVGIFATPLAVGLYVAALPDLTPRQSASAPVANIASESQSENTSAEL